ncbi:hypothetical protein [Streptomyces sp. NPDC059513]|uniref:hypothetical protein n=1 Tax=unclassified Streptomyces TaxID=2593676 RepID=UPI0036AFEE74
MRAPPAARLTEAAPDGIDVLVDTVGGEQPAAAVGATRQGARSALVGALSGQMSARRAGGGAPVWTDPFRIVVQGLSPRRHSGAPPASRRSGPNGSKTFVPGRSPPPPHRGPAAPVRVPPTPRRAPVRGGVGRRLATLDAGIDHLTRLRAELARRVFGEA